MANITEQEAIEMLKYRINTASKVIGTGTDGKAFEDIELAIKALENQISLKNEEDLIKQAIESAHCRIYRLMKQNEGSTFAHQEKAKNQQELMKITIKALEYYRDNKNKVTPSAESEEAIHAEWTTSVDDFDDGFGEREYPFCSNCHTGVYKHDAKNYCPNCGAKMNNKKIPKFKIGDEFYINQTMPSSYNPSSMVRVCGYYCVTKIDRLSYKEFIIYYLTQSCGSHMIRAREDILEKCEKK